jgi:hypothetical protein
MLRFQQFIQPFDPSSRGEGNVRLAVVSSDYCAWYQQSCASPRLGLRQCSRKWQLQALNDSFCAPPSDSGRNLVHRAPCLRCDPLGRHLSNSVLDKPHTLQALPKSDSHSTGTDTDPPLAGTRRAGMVLFEWGQSVWPVRSPRV